MPTENYKNRKKPEDANSNNSVIGVILIIVSVFFLICIIFSGFSILSRIIRNVVIGLIGYTSFPLFISLIVSGIALIQNKKAVLNNKNIVCIVSIGICLIFLLQFGTTQKYMTDISSYIDGVYKSNTIGGVLFGIIAYGVSLAITKPLTYAFFIVVMVILMALLFSDIFGIRGKRGKSLKKKNDGNIPQNKGFVKGISRQSLVQRVKNNGLFVETILPTANRQGDAIITESGKFDEIPQKPQPALSKYNNGKVEFEKYHKDQDAGKAKADIHKLFFGKPKEERLFNYDTNQQSFASSTSAYDTQRELFERHTSNYIPGFGNPPDAVKVNETKKINVTSNTSIASKYGLREITVPPPKKAPEKYLHGAILNGDEISEDLKKGVAESSRVSDNSNTKECIASDYFASNSNLNSRIINGSDYGSANIDNAIADKYAQNNKGEMVVNKYSGIINGDFFTKEEQESRQRQAEEKRLSEKELLNAELKKEALRKEEQRREEERREEERREEERREEERREEERREEQKKLQLQKRNEIVHQEQNFYSNTVSTEQTNKSTFESLLEADRAINRSPSVNENFNADEFFISSNEKNATESADEDDYYQPFEKEESTFSTPDIDIKINAGNSSFSYTYNSDNQLEDNSELQDNTIFENFSDKDAKRNCFTNDQENNFEENNFSFKEFENIGDEKTISSLSSCDQQEQIQQTEDQDVSANEDISDNFGMKILDGVIDKSETEFDEKYKTGYYQRENEETLTQKEARENDLRIAEDFTKNVRHIESNIFANSNKPKPSSQINIDDYLRSAAPITEKPVVKRKRNYKYVPPPVDLLLDNSTDPSLYGGDCEKKAVILEETLKSLKFPSKVIGITKGPAVTRYEMETTPGIPIKRVENCAKDIAYALASDGKIRIETPIPGRRAVGVEVPNEQISTVCLRDIISSKEFITAPSCLTLAVGKDITGSIIVSNLEKMPHLLIAGATGTGKSVCLNSIITSILYKSSPEDVRMILIDPKRVEFAVFKDMPHLLMKNIITEPAQVMNAFRWAKDEMERRYKLFSRYVNKNIQEFNNSNHVKSGSEPKMPYIVIIVDELSDLMMPHSNCRRELEDKIMSMAQKARAAGIHLILATQRPSVDVITGTIKANLPSRIAFAVTSIPDSRTILDQSGAEALLGKGDMLYSPLDWSDPKRVQGAYITSEEVEAVVEYVKENNLFDFDEEAEKIIMKEEAETETQEEATEDALDPHIKEALKRVIETGQASTSMIQRRFSVGYARAARIMDQMEAHKFVGPSEGAKPREVYITREQFREIFGEDV